MSLLMNRGRDGVEGSYTTLRRLTVTIIQSHTDEQSRIRIDMGENHNSIVDQKEHPILERPCGLGNDLLRSIKRKLNYASFGLP